MPAGAQAAAADGDIMTSWTSRSLSLVLAAARSRPGLVKVRTCTHRIHVLAHALLTASASKHIMHEHKHLNHQHHQAHM
jgi:hypothetical protein